MFAIIVIGGHMELEQIKGLGPKTVNILRRLGINSVYDLMTY